jgi:hypothetical protein
LLYTLRQILIGVSVRLSWYVSSSRVVRAAVAYTCLGVLPFPLCFYHVHVATKNQETSPSGHPVQTKREQRPISAHVSVLAALMRPPHNSNVVLFHQQRHRRRRARQRNDSLVDTCITGAGPRRNAAAQWQRNLSYHHPCTRQYRQE